MARVLADDAAKAAVARIQSILAGDLTASITALQNEGNVLSDANHWDGMLAGQFRGEIWPSHTAAIASVKAALEQLQQQVQRINADILAAGGNT